MNLPRRHHQSPRAWGVMKSPRPAYWNDVEADPLRIGFAYGGVYPGKLHAKGQLVDQHEVRFSVGVSGSYLLYVSLRPPHTPWPVSGQNAPSLQDDWQVPGSPFFLKVAPGRAYPLSTQIAPSQLPIKGGKLTVKMPGSPDAWTAAIVIQARDKMGNLCERNAPLGGWGYTTAEGGIRVPALVRWPNFIPAGSVSDELCTLMDLHPTFAKLAGAQLPERQRDGQNIWPVWSPRNAKSPHDHFFYYHTHSLQAVRDTRWKLVLGQNPKLYDLKTDSAEKTNLAAKHPEIIQRLQTAAARATAELGNGEQQGLRVRPVGRATKPTPRIR